MVNRVYEIDDDLAIDLGSIQLMRVIVPYVNGK